MNHTEQYCSEINDKSKATLDFRAKETELMWNFPGGTRTNSGYLIDEEMIDIRKNYKEFVLRDKEEDLNRLAGTFTEPLTEQLYVLRAHCLSMLKDIDDIASILSAQ